MPSNYMVVHFFGVCGHVVSQIRKISPIIQFQDNIPRSHWQNLFFLCSTIFDAHQLLVYLKFMLV